MALINHEQSASLKEALDTGTLKELIDIYGTFAQEILGEICPVLKNGASDLHNQTMTISIMVE